MQMKKKEYFLKGECSFFWKVLGQFFWKVRFENQNSKVNSRGRILASQADTVRFLKRQVYDLEKLYRKIP